MCTCTFPRKQTHQSSLSDESFDEDEGEDEAGGKDANQGNNNSNEERTDYNGTESDQEDTTLQADKAGSKTHPKDAGSCGGMAAPPNPMCRSKR